jgi:hypothetical protein
MLKNKGGKTLWSSPLTKKRNCFAILRGNSNFEIMSGKTVVWSNNTAAKQGGKGPYRLSISGKKGNIVIKNNRKKCSWALYGCPISKAFKRKLKRASPMQKYKMVKKLMAKQRKKRSGLPTKQKPIARGAPKIKNQLPKVLKRTTKPPKSKKKLTISKAKARNIKKLINNGGKGSIKKVLRQFKAPKKQKNLLKRLLKQGKSYSQIKRMMMRRLKKKVRKGLKKAKTRKAPNVSKAKTKKGLVNKVKKLSWMQKVKKAMKRKESPRKIKKMLRKLGNVRGNKRYWRKMTKLIKKGKFNKIAKRVALPVKQKPRKPLPKPKRWVTRRKLVRYYKKWRTWSWRRAYRGYWQRKCWRVLWWTRCKNVYRRTPYTYRYYYWTGAWRYRWQSYRRLE